MDKSSGRPRLALLLCGLGLTLPVWTASSVRAQDDEVINDPELAYARKPKKRVKRPSETPEADEESAPQPEWDEEPDEPASEPTAAPQSSDDQVFVDPELQQKSGTMSDDRSWGGMVPDSDMGTPRAESTPEHDPQANTGVSRLELIGQQGFDIRHEGDLEDAYETRLRFDAEVDFRRSRKLRMSIGLRTDLLWALPARDDKSLMVAASKTHTARNYTVLQQDRWELDIIPLSAFVDTTLGDAFHLRFGEQTVSMRRMDFYSPIDILATFDMRGQPRLDPSSGRLAQPAVRVDWDLGSWATLQVVYVPWFMPNLTRPNRDRYVANKLGTGGAMPPRTLEDLVDPSYQTKSTEQSLRFVGPAPDFSHPQAQARLNMRGPHFELAVSAGTALEKIPSVYLTPAAEAYAQGKLGGDQMVLVQLSGELPLADVEYHRYATIGLDGSFDLTPLSLGFEVAFSPSRHLTAATFDGSHLPQPNVSQQIKDGKSPTMLGNVMDPRIRKGVPMIQAALHLDWINGERFAIAAEGFIVKAMQLPYDLTRDWWGFIPDTGIFAGGLIGATYKPNPDSGRFRFDTSAILSVGPSIVWVGQAEVKATDGFYVNVGAQLFEGPEPTKGGGQNINLGGLFSGYDQAYVGFRYML